MVGRPSKKPRLVRHVLSDPTGASSCNVQRHRIYAVDPTGQIDLRTTYLNGTPAGATPELELGINTNLFEDPWNESQNDTSFLDTEPCNITGSKEIRPRASVIYHTSNLRSDHIRPDPIVSISVRSTDPVRTTHPNVLTSRTLTPW
ncbi:hypothetical protein BDR07DRAFT_1481550 [Suillus spraguei]|nr:hypothetical protein BDR07DRAFT_1481550 [Suillus spraguei]